LYTYILSQIEMAHVQLLENVYLNNLYQKYGFQKKVDLTTFMPLRLEQCDVSIVNGLRRICMSEIPNLAFVQDKEQSQDNIKIKIIKNTSQYHRDVILNRLEFVTINMDAIEDEGFDFRLLEFYLSDPVNVKQPLKNTTNKILFVTIHQHFQCFYQGQQLKEDTLKKICPFDSLFMTLRPNEEILIQMTPSLGVGINHARWNISCVMYKFGNDGDEQKSQQIDTNDQQMNYLGKDRKKPQFIILTIESIGKMASYRILQQGFDQLINSLKLIKFRISTNEIPVQYDQNMPNFMMVKLDQTDDTIGHIIQYACLNTLEELINQEIDKQIQNGTIKKEERQNEINKTLFECLFGYKKSHPLEKWIEFTIRTPISYQLSYPSEYQKYHASVALLFLAIEKMVQFINTLKTEYNEIISASE